MVDVLLTLRAYVVNVEQHEPGFGYDDVLDRISLAGLTTQPSTGTLVF